MSQLYPLSMQAVLFIALTERRNADSEIYSDVQLVYVLVCDRTTLEYVSLPGVTHFLDTHST